MSQPGADGGLLSSGPDRGSHVLEALLVKSVKAMTLRNCVILTSNPLA